MPKRDVKFVENERNHRGNATAAEEDHECKWHGVGILGDKQLLRYEQVQAAIATACVVVVLVEVGRP